MNEITRGSIESLVFFVFCVCRSCFMSKKIQEQKKKLMISQAILSDLQPFSLFLKPMKIKAAMELDILRCGYSRQLVHSIFFTIGIAILVPLFLLNFL